MPDNTPETTTPTTPTQVETPTPSAPPAETPPWGSDEDFDPAKAWTLIQNLRGDKAKTQIERDELAARVAAEETAKLSEQEKIAKELETARQELAEQRRTNALTRYELPESALVFLTAETAEDIDKQASALAGLTPKQEPKEPIAPGDSRAKPALPNGQPADTLPSEPDYAAIARRARSGR